MNGAPTKGRETTPQERLQEVKRTLRKRRGLVIKVALLFLAAILGATLLMTPKYKATASLYVRLEQSAIDPLAAEQGRAQIGAVSPMAVLNSYVETMVSRTTIEQIVREFQLDQLPPPTGLRDRIKRAVIGTVMNLLKAVSSNMAGGGAGAKKGRFRDTVDDLRDDVAAEIDEDTELVLVTVLHRNPQLAQRICQRMVEILTERTASMNRADSAQAYQSVMATLPSASAQLAKADRALAEFKRREGIVDLTEEQRAQVEQLSNLEMQHRQAETLLAENAARLATMQREFQKRNQPITLTTVLAEDPTVRQAKADLYEREQQLVALRQTHTEDHPDVLRVKAQVESAQERLRQEIVQVASSETKGLPPEYASLVESLVNLEADRMGVEAKERATGQLLETFRGELKVLPARERRLEERARDQRVAAQFYNRLAERADQLRMASQTGPPPITMSTIDPPRRPQGLADIGSPPYVIILIFGPFLALIIGLTAGFVAEYFDDTLGGAEEVEDRLALPVLVSVPHVPGLNKRAAEPPAGDR